MNFNRSRELFSRAQRSLAGGVSSSFRKKQRPVPLSFAKGQGAHVTDVDGNDFVDFTLAYGPHILGHSHPAVVAAVTEQVASGQTFGAQNPLEIELSETLLRVLKWPARLTYSTTGTEAVQVALRLARAHTGRSKIIRFAGHYHGWLDSVLGGLPPGGQFDAPPAASAGQAPGASADSLCLPWNDLDVVRAAFAAHPGAIAGIITEPLCANGGGILPQPGFLEGLRTLCNDHGAVLIFDEVITGFRVALGGSAELFNVVPDLSVFGKAVASGFPLSVVAGRADIMDLITNDKVFHAGTLNGNPISLAAAIATVRELERDGGAALKNVRSRGERLMAVVRRSFAEASQPVVIQGVGSVFWAFATAAATMGSYAAVSSYDGKLYSRMVEDLLEQGILVMPSGRWYVSAAHKDADIDRVGPALIQALKRPL